MGDNSETKDEKNETEEKDEKDSKSATIADVKTIVKEAFDEVKGMLSGDSKTSNDSGKDDEGKDGDKNKGRVSRERRSIRDSESDAGTLVKNAVREVLGDIEHENEHKRMKSEEDKKKRNTEQKPPAQKNRLREFMLGKKYMEMQDK